MYQQTDKKSAVTEIQKYLFFLSDKKYNSIPRVPIDGVFDRETAAAVSEFQKIRLLKQTGAVDLETFNALYEDYNATADDFYTTDYIFGSGSFPLREGNQNEDVRALHIMINELRKSYPQINDVGLGSYFSNRTGDAITVIRELFLFPQSRILDKELYRRIKLELEARKLAEEKY